MRIEDLATDPNFKEHASLALPRHLRPTPDRVRGLTRLGPEELARLVEDPTVPLGERLAAGGVLGLVGDPRLCPFSNACFVPGGAVTIGLAPGVVHEVVEIWEHVGVIPDWIAKETPAHAVQLDDFWIGKYPVTNFEYREFLDDTARAERPTTWYLGAYPYERANHPVAGISPEGADTYAKWLSIRTGHPWRLPTEAEWEHAAKGPEGRKFPWGDEFSPEAANTRETGIHTTTPVGAFPAGRAACGAYDMGGNVEEYVADQYLPYPGGQFVEDHLVETLGSYRVARGGSFSRFGDLTRTRRRHGAFPGPLYPVGLRLATSQPPRVS